MSHSIPDPNDYDRAMEKVYWACKQKHDGDFYLIGAQRKNRVLRHELAHGFFYLDPEYRAQMTLIVKNLPHELQKSFRQHLKTLGYTPKVYLDETQAYLATGLPSAMEQKILNKEHKPFEKLYQRYYKKEM